MRPFTDRDGARWDVVLGRESWGAIVALFVPVAGGDVRQAPLPANGYDSAMAALDAMDDGQLQRLLDHSQPKTD